MANRFPAYADELQIAIRRDPECAAAMARYDRAFAEFNAAAIESKTLLVTEYAPTSEWAAKVFAAFEIERAAYEQMHAAGLALNESVAALIRALAAGEA